ncbi:hypothetical protein [Methylotuvimicrobium buryatense]|uniref:Uncharacterized protein n=1 Tax=Methylotuvimicrobium buryatense TaxID=95641 RepID=A0A4P9UV47_METBY|nr:hypothetical protein [Methylotuvimicrobium buryatense]QCW84630.1 hypothetical protein EQU24_22090 [Methylotuvimicrobium buryatense]
MKFLRKVLLSLAIASSMGAIATPVMAESDPGRISYAPVEAIKLTSEKIQAAIDAVAAGSSADEVAVLVKDALDMSKEINANDKVDVARARANGELKKARNAAKKGSLDGVDAALQSALKQYGELPGLI